METLAAIASRRSVRTFTDQPVEQEKIETLLKAAMDAPSAGNERPWHFIVIDDRALLDKIAEIHPYAKMCQQAQQAVVVCAEPALQKFEGFWPQDLSAATQNFLLAVRDLGLGAVWCGVYPSEERIKVFQDLLQLPNEIIPFNVIAFGYTDADQKEAARYDEARIHHNLWSV